LFYLKIRFLKKLSVSWALLLFATLGFSQNNNIANQITNERSLQQGMEGLSLAELQGLLIQNNPQLRSATGIASTAQFGVVPARTLDNPTVNISQTSIPKNPLALGSSAQMNWGLSQNLPWPGKKNLSGEIAQAQAYFTNEQVALLKVQLLGQLKTSWVSWQQANSQITIARIQADRLEQIKEIVKLRYANNAAAYVDFINAQVTQAQIRSDIIGFERQAQSLLAQISALIGHTSPQPLRLQLQSVVADKSSLDLKVLQQNALEFNPALKASQFTLDAAQRAVDLAELGKRPDFNLGLTSYSSSPPWGLGKTDVYGVSLGASFPLYFAYKERNLIDQAKAQLLAARDADESLKQQVALQVETAYLQWAQSIEQLKLIEERVVAQARIGYRLALTNYSNNQATYMDLLNAYNALRASELTQEQSRSSAVLAKTALDVAVGTPQN
jgi:outer membrane protein TolC